MITACCKSQKLLIYRTDLAFFLHNLKQEVKSMQKLKVNNCQETGHFLLVPPNSPKTQLSTNDY